MFENVNIATCKAKTLFVALCGYETWSVICREEHRSARELALGGGVIGGGGLLRARREEISDN
jgi:hypothetical protein